MREIIIDTETTGLDPLAGHRVVEIGAVELLDHAPTGRTFHSYVCPQRARRELQAYLRRRLDTFVNPLVYTFWGNHGPSIMTMSAALGE